MWIANRNRPRFWCRLMHQKWWYRNDFGTWYYTSGRDTFEVLCLKCRDCWMEVAQLGLRAKTDVKS
jgi:hypothetical protein